jgi:hypothetical protein
MDVNGQFPCPVALLPVKSPSRYPLYITEYEAVLDPEPKDALEKTKVICIWDSNLW